MFLEMAVCTLDLIEHKLEDADAGCWLVKFGKHLDRIVEENLNFLIVHRSVHLWVRHNLPIETTELILKVLSCLNVGF